MLRNQGLSYSSHQAKREKIMNRILKSSLVAGATVLAISAAALPAAARSHVPFLGRAQNSAEGTCFSEWYGTVYNNGTCGAGEKIYIMPWVTDWAATYNAIVNVYSPGAPLHCQALGVDNIAVGLWTSPDTNVPVYWTAANINISAYVPANGSGYVACWLGTNARINMINY
jgi:hypothetical protein